MPQPFAFRGVFANISVFDPSTGKEQRFDVGASRTDGDYLPYFQSLTIKVGLAANAEISVVLAPPTYTDFIKLIESTWFRIGNTLGVRWGYTDDPAHVSPWYYTFMLKPDIQLGQDWSLTISGTGFDWSLHRTSSKKTWASEETDPSNGLPGPRALIDVITEIFAKVGMKVVTSDGLANDPDVSAALFEPRKSLIQSGLNDWAWCRKQVETIGCWFYVDKGFEVNIYKGTAPKAPKTTFVAFGPFDPSKGQFPLWNYKTETGAFFLPGRAVSTVQFGPNASRDPNLKIAGVPDAVAADVKTSYELTAKTRDRYVASAAKSQLTVVRTSNDEATIPQQLAGSPKAGTKALPATGDPDAASKYLPTASREDIDRTLTQAMSDGSVEKYGLQVEFDSLDDPTLSPSDLIRTENLGRPFNGNHRVISIEHRVGSEFGMMHIVAGQMGWNQDMENPAFFENAAKSQDQQPDASDSQTKSGNSGAGA